jgi:hypothetical protein
MTNSIHVNVSSVIAEIFDITQMNGSE